MNQKERIKKLIKLFIETGIPDAEEWFYEDFIPRAIKENKTLDQVIHEHADGAEDQDTSHYQLWEALTKIDSKTYNDLIKKVVL